jgi:hypothetical protein
MSQAIVPLLKTFFVAIEAAIVIVVAGFFAVEGFSGSTTLNVILMFLGVTSLAMLVGVFFESRKQR